MKTLRGLLFDKDGTLFDFQATWGGWAADLLLDLAADDPVQADALAARLRLDRHARRYHPDSVAVAGTTEHVVRALLPLLPDQSFSVLYERIVAESQKIEAIEAVPLVPLLDRLRAEGFVLGVATNDEAAAAAAQLRGCGVLQLFDFVAGADSGHGAKPGPGQCLAFAEATGIDPARVAMIGDSIFDLSAGAAAGMVPVGVLTGPATEAELAPFAAAILPDIGHLPGWLGLG
ncbi:HAD family hydrolase [Tropicimonas sp. IMCC34043]|uniref:HAD family hydrolase n=1 Tax=Tropicimonas sp. IMCC34043 TaxID=2248760 RepID=UPI0018E571E3|nr:HAD family hydrolase [Tropicimonas sp. IMCC34043]